LTDNKKYKSLIFKILALLLVAALLYLTVRGQAGNILKALKEANPTWIIASIIVFGLSILIQFYRWLTLLRIQNIQLPGAVSGDLIKMGTVMRRDPEKKIEAAMSIFMDRLLGLGALLIFVLLLLIPARDFILNESSKEVKTATLIVAAGALGGIFAMLMWFIRKRLAKIGFISKIINLLRKKSERLYLAFEQVISSNANYEDKWKSCLFLTFLSIISHSFLGISFYLLGLALNLEVSPILFILSIQVSNALAAVFPLPGGLGLRDAIGKYFLLAAGCSEAKAAAAPLLYSGVILFWGMIGALIFLYWRATVKKSSVTVSPEDL
jgi:uncharacterized protein (TIRG00374 family)